MFTPIWDGYHPWDKIFMYFCEDVTMDYMQYCCNDVKTLIASFRLLKSYAKIEMVL